MNLQRPVWAFVHKTKRKTKTNLGPLNYPVLPVALQTIEFYISLYWGYLEVSMGIMITFLVPNGSERKVDSAINFRVPLTLNLLILSFS